MCQFHQSYGRHENQVRALRYVTSTRTVFHLSRLLYFGAEWTKSRTVVQRNS
jgi:hypothetical protein